ncbi:hypothetical protein Tsubulata_021956 [Turnera subulata]|uniref:F-box associated beta-propeller type 1 domain-containing protein n=1 Tax=Turnera subulata TaxID=218843 RepID=A0A9Q0FFT0_9ROSI|nr:hypothetical protein Tsubulata_021956 [Turnera subulata]
MKEIVEEIIVRLPTESLIRFLCMSKEWYSYRSCDKLNKLRSKLAPPDEQLVNILDPIDLKVWNFNDRLETPSTLSFPLDGHVTPVCSCNGLVCISLDRNQNDLVLWNPNTGVFRQLPRPEDDTSRYQGCPAYGFGYDSNFPFKKPNTIDVDLIGSCDGLVCLSLDSSIGRSLFDSSKLELVLWNPCKGIHREMPKLDVDDYRGARAFGFGYAPASCDYKIFIRVMLHSREEVTQIFSLKENSWKKKFGS